MNRFAYAQDILKNSAGSVGAGFNRRIGGQSFTDAFQYPHERTNQDMVAGWEKAEEMIRAGQIFYVHNFHKLDCPNGYAFQYGGTYVCNTCNRDHLDKEWWKIKVMRDGSSWCCVGNGFINLQESDNFAFGDTREQAIQVYGELMLAKERTPASPVQGAASFAPGWDVSCTVTDSATSSASGAKGAAVKPWRERADEDSRANRPVEWKSVYMEREIAELRAALADRSPAVQSVAGQSVREPEFRNDDDLIAWLDGLYECDENGAAYNIKCRAAQRAILAIRMLPTDWQAQALRQYQHNDGSGLVAGYDKATIDRLFACIEQKQCEYEPYIWFHEKTRSVYQTSMPFNFLEACTQLYRKVDRLATPAPEQEAAPKNGEDGYLCPAGKAQAAVREVVQVAPPGAQEAVYQLRQHGAFAGWVDCERETEKRFIKSKTEHLYEFRTLYTAPVPTTTPAEQPEATADTLRAIRDEITVYYRALDSRQHGGVAQNKAFMSIESALGMCWEAHRAAIKANN